MSDSAPFHSIHRMSYFDSAMLYRQPQQKYLTYLPGFCAFIFMLVISSLASLLLWQYAGLQSSFKYSEFYILLPPTQFLLAVILLAILWSSALLVNMVCRAMVQENLQTLNLLVLLGADDKYINRSFDRVILKQNMVSICIGAAIAGFFLLGFRLYWLWFFSTVHSLLPKIGAMELWLLMLWIVTIATYGVLLLFNSDRVIRRLLSDLYSSRK